MPTVAEAETIAPVAVESGSPLLDAVRDLPEEGQRAVLSYALFLRHQEEERRTEAYHDAEWERLFNDPIKMANFAKWAEESAARHPSEPFDYSKL